MKNKALELKLIGISHKQNTTWLINAKRRRQDKDWSIKSTLIALKILRVLRKKNISQKELAESLNISPQQISKILKGRENLTLETISKLESILNIELVSIPKVNYFELKLSKPYKQVLTYNFNKVAKECIIYDNQTFESYEKVELEVNQIEG